MNRLDLDARRIETRANKLIEKHGLGDEQNETGGLIAQYKVDEKIFVVEDESYREEFPVEDDGFIAEETWNNIRCHILSFTDHGCPEEHNHFQSLV